MATSLEAGAYEVAIGRITLVPGASIAIGDGGLTLIVAEEGDVSASLDARAWKLRGVDGHSSAMPDGRLLESDGLSLDAETSFALLNTSESPASILVLTFTASF
jgi:hypothetical protein